MTVTPVRQGELTVPLTNARQIRRELEQTLGDEMNHLAFPLDATANTHHAGRH